MAFLQANVYSNVLGMEVLINVILPQQTTKIVGTDSKGTSEDVPVLYLLHGMGGNHSVWARRTAIERYVAEMGIAVIMPSTDLGFYTDTTYDMKYWTYISEELPEICQELFPQLSTKRERTFAAGLSMGGYGAMKLGFSKPERFSAVASLSGALSISGDSEEALFAIKSKEYWTGIFGDLDAFEGSSNDLKHLLNEALAAKKELPAIFLTCGEEDPLLPASRSISELLSKADVAHYYETGPGAHNWVFWDQWIQKVLEWLPLEVNKEN